MPDTKTCAHKGCDCKVEEGKAFCCDSCEKAEKQGTVGKCTCGCPK